MAVVHVDAHRDTSGPEPWGERYHHGTPFRLALDEGLVAPGDLHQLAMRGPLADRVDGRGGRVRWMDELAARGVDAVAAEVLFEDLALAALARGG